MKRANELIYISTYSKKNTYSFIFQIDRIRYRIQFTLSSSPSIVNPYKENILINIGMVFLVNLAEIVLPQKIEVRTAFTQKQIDFWRKIYKKIAIEKIFLENLDPSILDIPWKTNPADNPTLQKFNTNTSKNTLLCMSAGKESITALRLLHKQYNLSLFSLETNENIYRKKSFDSLSSVFPSIESITNESEIRKLLKKRYKQNQYGRFTTGLLVFQCLLFTDKFSKVIINNEYSANFGNTIYKNHEVNHQYVKSFDLAYDINNYIHRFITSDFSYISPFFGLYEYKILDLFFREKKYINLWTSCNRNNKKNFCSSCFKCSFTYIIALAYKDKSFLTHFFEKDMLQNLFLTLPLMHFDTIKPFDCVGEKKEVWVALHEIYKQKKDISSPTMQYFLRYIYPRIKTKITNYKKEITSFHYKKFPYEKGEKFENVINAYITNH